MQALYIKFLSPLIIVAVLLSAGTIYAQDNRVEMSYAHLLRSEADKLITSDPLAALETTFKALSIAEQTNDLKFIASIYSQIGKIYHTQGYYAKALHYYSISALTVQTALNNTYDEQAAVSLAWVTIDIGNIYYILSDYKHAVFFYRRTADFFKVKDPYGLATAYNNIGLCHEMQGNLDSALYYFNSSLKIRETLGVPGLIAHSLIYIARVMSKQDQAQSALEYFEKSKSIYLTTNNSEGIAQVLQNTSNVKYSLGRIDESIADIEESIKIFTNIGDQYQALGARIQKMGLLYNTQNFAELLVEGKIVMTLSNKLHFLSYMAECSNLLSITYEKTGNYKDALFYFKQYQEVTHQIHSAQLDQQTAQIDFRIRSEQLEGRLRTLESENKISELQNNNHRNLLYYFVLSAFLLILIIAGNLRKFNYRFELLRDLIRDFDWYKNIGISFVMAIYYTVFLLIFKPFGIESMTKGSHTGDFVLFGIITSAFIILCFRFFVILEKKILHNWFHRIKYFLFSFSALAIAGLAVYFIFIYRIDDKAGLYILINIYLYILSASVMPLLVLLLYVEKILLRRNIQEASIISKQLKSYTETDTSNKMIVIRSHKSKEIVEFRENDLLFIEAQGNYSRINYLQDGHLRQNMMLITMKSLEEQLDAPADILRCHKSFIINIRHIEKVTGNSRGYQLHLGHGLQPVPVSRNFPQSLRDRIGIKS